MATTKKGGTSKKAAAAASTKKASARTRAAKSSRTSPKAPANGTAPAKKKVAAVKINERQTEFLKKIKDAGETGFETANKNDLRTIEALLERKLVKKGSKNKATGQYRYLITKAGEKHLPAAPAPEPAPAPSA